MAKAKSIRVKKEGQGKTNVCRSHLKRILMLRRRISILIDEKESLEEKNRDLINSYNSEKKLNAELQKDVFNWQRLYHEAKMSQNTYKVKQAEIEQVVSSCLKELKSTFPHLVGLSDTICRNQIRLTNLQNACHTFERENNHPLSRDGRQACSDLSNKSEKRMRHKVGPMVNGVLIQKPTIRLERVMLQQPPDQATNNERTPERGNNLTPIAEENEQEADLHLEQVSMRRRRKHRLGTGERWRLRKQQEQLEKERQKERERERESQIDSSDSEDQLGPVIRLQRVSGLLLSPNLLEVDRGRSSEGKGTSRPSDSESLRLRSNEDPREGCSWMHMSSQKISAEKRKERQSESSPSSDSTDEESDSLNAVAEKVRKSFTDSLFKNQSFVKRKTSSSSSVADTSRDVSDSSKIEPDSTNNIDTVICPGTTIIDDSLAMNNSLQLDATRSPEERESVGVAINPSSSAVEDSVPERRPSSFCNNCTPAASPNVRGKRIRKPKVHLYPGEEYENQAPTTSTTTAEPKVKKMKKTVTANNKKSVPSRLSDSRKSTGKRPLKNSMEPGSRSSSVERQSLKNSQDPSISSAIKKKTQQRKTKSLLTKSSVGNSRTSENMRLSQDQVLDESDRRNSRRNKAPVSYKEPPGNVKMRRPK